MLTFIVFITQISFGHSGGTDAYGCHAGSKPYHCHGGGSLSIPTFTSTPTRTNTELPSALCNDGTLSYSTSSSGTCSHHGGVYYWITGKTGDKYEYVVLPSNSHPNEYSSRGWTCNSGYKSNGSGCSKVVVPANAQLDYYGNDWICNRGYKEHDGKCYEVRIPENAQLDYYGRDWICNRGYKEHDGKCHEVRIPENAQLDYYGRDWICNRGYKEHDGKCYEK